MAQWITIPEHIIFILLCLSLIIVIQAVVIRKLIKAKNEQVEDSKIGDLISRFRNFWGEFIVYVLATSIIGLFVVSLVKKENITLSDINNWVSIILGFVALIVGIISLWLSFYNVDQANQAHEKMEKTVKESMKKIGWHMDENGEWLYFQQNGEIARGEWKKSGDNWYYLGIDGYVEKDRFIFEDNGSVIYYVNKDGVMVTNTFVTQEGKKRYFLDDGKAIMDGEEIIDGQKYIFKNGFVENEQ
jgi:hypothetical protein|nr:MAG TPA: hypothetical protein [Caudoviricetes sp.]